MGFASPREMVKRKEEKKKGSRQTEEGVDVGEEPTIWPWMMYRRVMPEGTGFFKSKVSP